MIPKKILVLRFSAMGDVVLLVPVLKSLITTHPDVQVTVVTRPKFASFFHGLAGVVVFKADVDKEYTGFNGLFQLFRDISKRGPYDVVIDLHDHVRTILLRNLLRMNGHRVVVFEKGRADKKLITRKEGKVRHALPHTVQRYQNAFAKAGLIFPIIEPPYLLPDKQDDLFVSGWLASQQISKKENETWIGVAPFAMHKSKIWPVKNYFRVAENILTNRSAKFFLFGGGKKEIEYFESFRAKFPKQTIIVAGQLKLQHELALMKQLDLMLCVDSSNMHLAALVGAPLLSIWGGTHLDAGFGPYGKMRESIIEIPATELECRPCSVYGIETCHRGDFACLNRITPQQVVERMLALLKS